MTPHPYAGMTAALATMHRKEEAIAPPLAELGIKVEAAAGIDTDALGTFTGEVARVGTMLEVAVKKARLGMSTMGTALGLASEGTFGPHPQIPLLPAGMELLAFVDDQRGLVISESLIAEETNFDHVIVAGDEMPKKFLQRVKFPHHGLIVRPNSSEDSAALHKGVVNRKALRAAIAKAAAASSDGKAMVQTDMRACFNPTRMRSLRTVATKIAQRLARLCPQCGAPGFGVIDVERGLPCEVCGEPTHYVFKQIFGCSVCGHRASVPRSDGLQVVEQMYCEHCNP